MTTEMTTPLTQAEATRLDQCEMTISTGIKSFLEVGNALLEIRERKLYRTTYSSFSDYISAKWPQLSRSSVYRAMDTATVVEIVAASPMGDNLPNERQARELAPLRDDPEKMRQVWANTIESTNGKPTAAAIRQVRDQDATSSRRPSPKVTSIRNYFADQREQAEVMEMADVSEDDFEAALEAARGDEDLSRENVLAHLPVPSSSTEDITGEEYDGPGELEDAIDEVLAEARRFSRAEMTGVDLQADYVAAVQVLSGLAAEMRRRRIAAGDPYEVMADELTKEYAKHGLNRIGIEFVIGEAFHGLRSQVRDPEVIRKRAMRRLDEIVRGQRHD